jgi:proline iminopeptidase
MLKNYKIFLSASLSLIACLGIGDSVVDHHVKRGDVSLFYETEGNGDPVILLAGGPGVTPYSVKPVEDYVSINHMAVLVHQRGTGKTPLPALDKAHLSLSVFIDDIDAVRQDLHADKVVLIGHSWGGMLAMAYAGAHPDRVSHLVLMDSGGANLSFTGVFQDNINMHLTPDDLALRKKVNEDAKRDPSLASFDYLLSILPGYFYSRDNALAYEKTLKPTDFNPALQRLLGGFDISKSIINYRGPVDIIQGRQDPIDPSTITLNMKYLPQAKVHWIERAGHIPWLEEPADFQRTISQVLSGS